jgi:hypothetical protein
MGNYRLSDIDLSTRIDLSLRMLDPARAVRSILDSFHRTSSLAESLPSWVRPYLLVFPTIGPTLSILTNL